MLKGVSTFQIESPIKNLNNNNINENFVGVVPANNMNIFIDYKSLISFKKGNYPFVIANTDSAEKSGTHWWSILYIEPNTVFFLFVWIEGLESFIIQDDKNIIEKILKHIEKMTRTDKKIDV